MFLCVGAFTALKVIQWITFEEPDFIVNIVLKNLYEEYDEPFEADQNRFDFALTFLSIKTESYKFVQYDPRYGDLTAHRIDMDMVGDEITFNQTLVKMSPCNTTSHYLGE